MIYVVRQRYKEWVKPEDFPKVSRVIDEVNAAMEKIEGVRACRAYNSSGGEIVILVEVDGLAAIDRALVDKEYNRIASQMFEYMMRVGGEVWFDRASWDKCYGRE
jgi:hypothetical protein